MTVELRPVTVENFHKVIKLQVRPDQRQFVASNVYSIAQSKFYPDWQPMAVYAKGALVGFVMWGIDHDQPVEEWWVIRLMIDAQFQGMGYGRAAMRMAIEAIREAGATAIFLSFEPENKGAEKLYRSLGFVDTGRVEYGEIVYRLALDKQD